jgi:alkyldihydroxyacetonephosphate synthase
MVDWAGSAQAAVIPFGAGSSVVGGVEAKVDGDAYRAANLRRMG